MEKLEISKNKVKVIIFIFNKFKNHKGVIELNRSELIEYLEINKSTLSRWVNNSYILENKLKKDK